VFKVAVYFRVEIEVYLHVHYSTGMTLFYI